MNRRPGSANRTTAVRGPFALILVVAVAAGACRERSGSAEMFTDPSVPVRDGIAAIVHVGPAAELPRVNLDTVPAPLALLVPAPGTALDLFVLDPEAYGGSLAIVVGGDAAEDTIARWLEAGLLADAGDGALRLQLASQLGQDMERAGAFFGSMLPLDQVLRRFDQEGRIALVPTIDLRAAAFDQARAAAVVAPAGLSVYLSGRTSANVVERVFTQTFSRAHSLARAAGAGQDPLATLHGGMLAVVAALRGLHGIALRWEPGDWRAHVAPVAGTPLGRLIAAGRPLEGSVPRGRDAVFAFAAAFAPEDVLAADRDLVPERGDRPYEALSHAWSGTVTAGVGRALFVAFSLRDGVDGAALVAAVEDSGWLEDLAGGWSTRPGWLLFGEEEAGREFVVAGGGADSPPVAVGFRFPDGEPAQVFRVDASGTGWIVRGAGCVVTLTRGGTSARTDWPARGDGSSLPGG